MRHLRLAGRAPRGEILGTCDDRAHLASGNRFMSELELFTDVRAP